MVLDGVVVNVLDCQWRGRSWVPILAKVEISFKILTKLGEIIDLKKLLCFLLFLLKCVFEVFLFVECFLFSRGQHF